MGKGKIEKGEKIKFRGAFLGNHGSPHLGSWVPRVAIVQYYDFNGGDDFLDIETTLNGKKVSGRIGRNQVTHRLRPKPRPPEPEKERVERWFFPVDNSFYEHKQSHPDRQIHLVELREGDLLLSGGQRLARYVKARNALKFEHGSIGAQVLMEMIGLPPEKEK